MPVVESCFVSLSGDVGCYEGEGLSARAVGMVVVRLVCCAGKVDVFSGDVLSTRLNAEFFELHSIVLW